MIGVSEKQFVRAFILEMILIEKDSVFDLDYEERVNLPKDYLEILDRIVDDDVKRIKYSSLIPVNDRKTWKQNTQNELMSFLNSEGISYEVLEENLRISLNRYAISSLLGDKSLDIAEKIKITCLTGDFLIEKNKTKPKIKMV